MGVALRNPMRICWRRWAKQRKNQSSQCWSGRLSPCAARVFFFTLTPMLNFLVRWSSGRFGVTCPSPMRFPQIWSVDNICIVTFVNIFPFQLSFRVDGSYLPYRDLTRPLITRAEQIFKQSVATSSRELLLKSPSQSIRIELGSHISKNPQGKNVIFRRLLRCNCKDESDEVKKLSKHLQIQP